ncbi:MAG: ATP-binding cassette domain-containing protein [Mariprofundaceae bacterium]|nr:ATP-binding cassette domain-containing protein [Mariprofundaceae bacterium]
MIYFNDVSLRHGTKLLFQHMTWVIHEHDKIGLTGANGTGKSSLFSLIRGELEEDTGQFSMQKNITLAHVAQETPALDTSAIAYVMQGDSELESLQQTITQVEQQDDGIRLTQLHERMAQIDGYAAHARAARLMHGLGFKSGQEEQSVASFSGGWRMRLNLAQALMCRSDVLLLDEPTNHLDLEAVIWLETWLQHYQGALLLISHDRDFLDQSIKQIAHIERQSITLYTGNYSDFERMRAEKMALQQSSYEKQQREVEHMQDYIRRFRAKASKAKQAQSRIKALERMELITSAHVDSPFSFTFKQPDQVPNPLLRLTKVTVGYGEHHILENVTMGLLPGERLGLLGKNGSGKSTLIKVLAGEMPPLLGQYEAAQGLRIGYFAQHQLEQLHDDLSPLQHLQMLNAQASEKELRLFLGGFAFRDDMALECIRGFSGGEKARLVLAILVYQQPNLLLLDEPTNHLDMDMRHALSIALQSFEGAMILISHDRHLLRMVCDDLLLVSDGKIQAFDDDLDAYATWLMQHDDVEKTRNDDAVTGKKEQRKLNHDRRKQLKPLRDQIRQLEKTLDQLQIKKDSLAEQLADADLYSGDQNEKLKQLTREHGMIQQQVDDTEEAWMQACEDLERANDEC